MQHVTALPVIYWVEEERSSLASRTTTKRYRLSSVARTSPLGMMVFGEPGVPRLRSLQLVYNSGEVVTYTITEESTS